VIFEGSLLLRADVSRVWDFLLDMNKVSSCVPGIQSVKQIDSDAFEGTITAAVGPMSGNFSFRARITERRPPAELVGAIDGTDSVTKSRVTGETAIRLTAVRDGETELAYRSTVEIQGRLAILGELVLRATGNLMLRETTERLRKQVEAVETA
jgi:carbon monoxide dehydrogenase subunit G